MLVRGMRVGQLLCGMLVLVCAGACGHELRSRPGPHPGQVCYPPAWGGIVPGFTEDRDLMAMYGEGLFSDELGHAGGRYYTNPERTVTLIVEIGVDAVIESLTLKSGPHPPTGSSAEALPASPRMDRLEGFGNWGRLHLGSTRDQVRANIGPPASLGGEDDKDPDWWVYDTDYMNTECAAHTAVAMEFSAELVISVMFYNGE